MTLSVDHARTEDEACREPLEVTKGVLLQLLRCATARPDLSFPDGEIEGLITGFLIDREGAPQYQLETDQGEEVLLPFLRNKRLEMKITAEDVET